MLINDVMLTVFTASKASIAPPPSLMDLDIPPPEGFLQKEKEREAAAAAAAAASEYSFLYVQGVSENNRLFILL